MAILAAAWLADLLVRIGGALLVPDSALVSAYAIPFLVLTPVLIAAIWTRFNAARIAYVALYPLGWAGMVVLAQYGALLGLLRSVTLVAELAGIVALFSPQCSAWFRGSEAEPARSPVRTAFLWTALFLGAVVLMALAMFMLGSFGVWFLYLAAAPAQILGGPHFSRAQFPGPNDWIGAAMTAAFYAFIFVGILAFSMLVRDRMTPRAGGVFAAVLGAMLAVMVAPGIGENVKHTTELEGKRAAAQEAADRQIPDYPKLEGSFNSSGRAQHYGVKSSGHWTIANGALEIVIDSTELAPLHQKCVVCEDPVKLRFGVQRPGRGGGGTLGSAKQWEGVDPLPVKLGPDGRFTLGRHRVLVPITEDVTVSGYRGERTDERFGKYVQPKVLASYWPFVEVIFPHGSETVALGDPFAFQDSLAAQAMAPARCAKLRGAADAVERRCHAELDAMLSDPARAAEAMKGDRALRRFSEQETPLEIAMRLDDARAADILLAHGGDPNHEDVAGYTLLMRAALANAANVIPVLVRHGARVDERYRRPGNDSGKTALIFAAVDGNTEAVTALLASGADRSIRTSIGKDARQLAENFGHRETAALLR